MKKTLLLVLLLMGIIGYAQNLTLTNYCNDSSFDLTQLNSQIMGNQNPPQATITYHLTQGDATNNLNAIADPTNFTISTTQQVVFARVLNSIALTTSIVPVNLVVNSDLQVILNTIITLPSSIVTAWVNGGQEPYTYLWAMNGTPVINGGPTFMLPPNTPGMYVVTATVTDVNGCSSTSTVSVFNPPMITIEANDDSFTLSNLDGTTTPPGNGSVLFNDTAGGQPANLNTVSLNLLSTTNPNVGLTPDGRVSANSNTPSGLYTLIYQICDLTAPGNCDTATVTVLVDYCRANTPIIDAVTQPTCSVNTGAVALSGLPEMGTWTINYKKLPNGPTQTLTGAGTTTSIPNLAPGSYQLNVLAEDILLANCFESFNINLNINDNLFVVNTSEQGTYIDFNNDGYTNVGDIVQFSFTVQNSTCGDITDFMLHSGLEIQGGPIAFFPQGTTDSTTFTAVHVITQEDINYGEISSSLSISGMQNGIPLFNDFAMLITYALNTSDGIKLNAFLDLNTNGIQDPGEINFSQGEFSYSINGGSDINIATNSGQHYIYESNPTNVYHLGYAVNPAIAANYSVSPSSYTNVTVAQGSGITTYNFPITILPYNDLAVYLYTYSAPPRPGFIYQNYITYTNQGIQAISGTVTFVKDPLLNITGTSAAGVVMNANGFTYDFTNLQPHETRFITVNMQVPTIPTVALGQQLTNTCSITLTPNDIAPNNNTSSLTQIIVGSYDPNDKSESHGSEVVFSDFSADDYLTYTIRFENTGTANAINVKVDDVLDTQLDESSVRTIASSHPYVLKRTGAALSWQFDGIDLPPSVDGDPVTGHGYVVFQVKPKAGFALGDIIPNSANIYFDFNPAIVTNTCTTEFVPFLGVDVFAGGSLEYYPNPTSGMVTFNLKNSSSAINTVEVMDILGKTLLSKTVDYREATLDLSSFEKGIYLVKIKANGQEETIKIAKQ
ncbi:T9SS type A sorting domain-containing protein [Flavobacterium sp. CYK-55]|uniref:DUF7619 domain-containing protein n=1 Tax=Flavobacterium sp. CYK-55 TaxID=2835529 RepID=UPI001BD05463|nr:T9SS type A sorting domain-containing protein [Flavobacterium sp. CYK-55]MBS7787856.1 T9SS type A sorting domain-containing protein [Flavobacterium sp. CYK-55]